jgi:hypothetical protein
MDSIVVDLWNGPNSMNHAARYVRPWQEAVRISVRALEEGYLVNLRADHGFDERNEFDNTEQQIGRA